MDKSYDDDASGGGVAGVGADTVGSCDSPVRLAAIFSSNVIAFLSGDTEAGTNELISLSFSLFLSLYLFLFLFLSLDLSLSISALSLSLSLSLSPSLSLSLSLCACVLVCVCV